MLKHCANFPRALEVLLNAYPCVPSCDAWVEAVLPELWQVCLPQGHRYFLDSGGDRKEIWVLGLSFQYGLPEGAEAPPSTTTSGLEDRQNETPGF